MVYEVENGYVISSHQCWLPGIYDTERAAKYAFRFDSEILDKLNKQINLKENRNITFNDLKDQKDG